MFNGAYNLTYYSSFNGAYGLVNYYSSANDAYNLANYKSSFNGAHQSFPPAPIELSAITSKPNKFRATLDTTVLPMHKFYIFRRRGFLTTIVMQIPAQYQSFVEASLGKELIIYWESEDFNGIMANSLLQDISYRYGPNETILSLHAFRAKKEVAQRKFILKNIEAKRVINGVFVGVTCSPQPTIGPEDTVEFEGVDYTVKSVKITADTKATRMEITFG